MRTLNILVGMGPLHGLIILIRRVSIHLTPRYFSAVFPNACWLRGHSLESPCLYVYVTFQGYFLHLPNVASLSCRISTSTLLMN